MKDAAQQITTNAFFSDMKSQLDSKVRDLDEGHGVCLPRAHQTSRDRRRTDVQSCRNFLPSRKKVYHPMSNEEEKGGTGTQLVGLLAIGGKCSSDRLFRTQENFRKTQHALMDFTRSRDSRGFQEKRPVSEQLKLMRESVVASIKSCTKKGKSLSHIDKEKNCLD